MSKYNLELREKYYSLYSTPLGLNDFMIISSNEDGKRFIIVKFTNNTSDMICRAKFELIQQNDRYRDIRKADYWIENVEIPPFKEIVLNKKIEIDASCSLIKARLLYAETSQKKWENRLWTVKDTNDARAPSAIYYQKTIEKRKGSIFPFYISVGIIFFFILIVREMYQILNR